MTTLHIGDSNSDDLSVEDFTRLVQIVAALYNTTAEPDPQLDRIEFALDGALMAVERENA